jgi:hypothetical protein
MSIEAVEAVVELIEMGAVVGNPAIVKCLRSALNEPQQRTWVGLSVFEINDLVENTEYEDYRDLVERTEAKLKEKNT